VKKTFLICFILLFVASMAFAANFAPVKMVLTASENITYGFDGSELKIPVEVAGTPATLIFFVYTKGQANNIGIVQNGFMGWHYVNKVDTCIFVSPAYQFGTGKNTVTWNGKDADGGKVPLGEYAYYMWAYDNVNVKIPCTKQFSFTGTKGGQIEWYDEAGLPYANPMIYPCVQIGQAIDKSDPTARTRSKWIIGGDPEDVSLKETTAYMAWTESGFIALQPDDQKIFWVGTGRTSIITVRKYEWIPNGDAVQDMMWGDEGEYSYSTELPGNWVWESGVITDGKGMLYMANHDISGIGTESELIYVDMEEGFEQRRIDLGDWWVDLEDGAAGGQSSGGPTTITYRNGFIYTSSHTSCIKTMMDPFLEDDDETTKWVNQNGDYIGDHNFEETAQYTWVCNDYNVAPYMYTTGVDNLMFSAWPVYDLGALSFGLAGPDGTGIGHFAYANETAKGKQGTLFLQNGSAYDGIYCDNSTGGETGWWFVGFDSIMGTIGTGVGVAADEPDAFSVAQNSPNPFNPTTTISFSLVESGNVVVDIYNVAGQKVDTVVNEFKDAGSHSVVWDASGLSAGVYFYTVKSGGFSKTMKMTLLK